MWKMYDELIGGIPQDVYVEDVVAGHFWVYVRSNLGAGVSVSAVRANRPFTRPDSMIGKPVREVAERVKSWNLVEASIGLAAINSYYNTPEIARANGVTEDSRVRVGQFTREGDELGRSGFGKMREISP